MSNKKVIMSVTATAAIAASFAAADQASAASYKVKSGDSLWTIAQKHSTSVSSLKSINKLSSDIIYPNQVIETSNTTTKPSSNSSNTSTKPSQSTSSKTYTVKSGDSLSRIAAQHNISLSNLMKWNNLKSTLIFPGNKLNVGGASSNTSSNTSNATTSSKPAASTSNATSYKVKSGDTLGAIGKRHGVSVSNLKSWNGLRSDMIYVGQTLKINGSKAPAASRSSSSSSNVQQTSNPTTSAGANVNTLISTAKAQVGTPYAWGGSAPGGFDCSGFIHYTFNQAGKSMGRTNAKGYDARSFSISNPQVGDLVFFKDTYTSGISHLGIYLGGGNFIHAGGDRVQITSVSNPYWSKHFAGYKRFY